jgi:hypothetical protein
VTPEWERFIRADKARAQHTRDTAHPCAVCKRSMIAWPGRLRHFSCEKDSLASKVCTCPPGCSGAHYGDGPRQCAPACEVCRMMRGKPIPKRMR